MTYIQHLCDSLPNWTFFVLFGVTISLLVTGMIIQVVDYVKGKGNE